jgi:hypothetical protein
MGENITDVIVPIEMLLVDLSQSLKAPHTSCRLIIVMKAY